MNRKQQNQIDKERDEKIVDSYSAGNSSTTIGREFNLTHQRICQILKRNNVETRINLPSVHTCRACSIHFTRLDNPKSKILCDRCDGKVWSKKFGLFGCKECGRNEEKHHKEGYCTKCYYALPEVQEFNSKRHIEYYAENSEKIKQTTREWQKDNKDKTLKNTKRWQAKNLERCHATAKRNYDKYKTEWIMYYYLMTLIPEEVKKKKADGKRRRDNYKTETVMYNYLLSLIPEEVEKRKKNYEKNRLSKLMYDQLSHIYDKEK